MWHARRMPCDIPDARELVGQLDAVSVTELDRYTKFEVEGRTFGYLWEPTATVGLKQTIAEQTALVAERPEVFEVQFTAYGYGWVVVHLDGVERDELAELVFEAWRLSAPASLLERRGERLPTSAHLGVSRCSVHARAWLPDAQDLVHHGHLGGFGREWTIAALERGDRVAATARDTSTLDDLVEKYGDALLPSRST